VFGFVSMKQAVRSESAAFSAATSTHPSFDAISFVTKPAMLADAGFVPWAVSGRRTSVRRSSSPRSR